MNVSLTQIIITLFAALISGMGTAVVNSIKFKKTERKRAEEKARDELQIELKDLQIKLYKLEKDLNEWKDKYFEALQELIRVKAELEGTMLKLTHIEMHSDED
jgi:peptidoglycan hydrolase CwlO-like protein